MDGDEYLQDVVEVTVSDNASTDNTREVVEKYKSSFKHFNYSANEKNIGFDLNVVNVVKKATATYCWYLGDDDTIVNGGIAHIVNILMEGKHDVVTVEAEPITENRDYRTKQTFHAKSIIEVAEFNDFYFRDFCQGGFSVLVFNREMWLACLDTENYLTFWIYFETILKMLTKTKKTMVNVRDFVIITGQDCRWSENGSEMYTFMNGNILLERMIDFGFDRKRIEKYLEGNRKQLPLILLRAKGHGLRVNRKNLSFLYKNTKNYSASSIIVAAPLFFFPNSIVRIIRDLKKLVLK